MAYWSFGLWWSAEEIGIAGLLVFAKNSLANKETHGKFLFLDEDLSFCFKVCQGGWGVQF
jgi:hypothetical protein